MAISYILGGLIKRGVYFGGSYFGGSFLGGHFWGVYFGGSFWGVILGGHFGGSFWGVIFRLPPYQRLIKCKKCHFDRHFDGLAQNFWPLVVQRTTPPPKKDPKKWPLFLTIFLTCLDHIQRRFKKEAILLFRLIAFCWTLRTCWMKKLEMNWLLFNYYIIFYFCVLVLCHFSSYLMISRRISVESMSMALIWTGVGWPGKCSKLAKIKKKCQIYQKLTS